MVRGYLIIALVFTISSWSVSALRRGERSGPEEEPSAAEGSASIPREIPERQEAGNAPENSARSTSSTLLYTPRRRLLGEVHLDTQKFATFHNPAFIYPLLTIIQAIDSLEHLEWKITRRPPEAQPSAAFPRVIEDLTILRAWIREVLLAKDQKKELRVLLQGILKAKHYLNF